MDTVITYDTVKALVANPPSLGNRCPNFFNLSTLQSHFARTLKRITCPQCTVNGWAGMVLMPVMYALIDPKPFNIKLLMLPTSTRVPEFPPIYASDSTTVIPYTRVQMLRITATFTRQKNYYDTACNVYCTVYDTLDAYIDDAFKVAPPTTPPTIGWNASMSLNDIFDQLMKTYGLPTPDAMHQNMMNFLAPYNPQDPPEILCKQCADCQEVAIIANVKYTNEQLLMNIINLLTQCGLYQCDLEDWECKPDAEKTWLNLRPFIQEAYQHCLASGQMTTSQGGYTSRNHFAEFANATDKEVSDDDTAKTITTTINSYMANLSVQTAASLDANATKINASLQQLATNNAQLHQQQQLMMQQMAMLTTNANTPRNNTYFAPPQDFAHYTMPMIHPITGESIGSYKHLMQDPATTETWMTAFGKDFGRMCQGNDKTGQLGTNAMFVMTPSNVTLIPTDRTVTYVRVVVDHCPQKADPNRIRITASGNLINYPGELTTRTADVTMAKFLWNSVLSTPEAKYMCLDMKKNYLSAPLDCFEYMHIPYALFPPWIVEQYALQDKVLNRNINMEMHQAM
jgi:hypothetical protein